MPYASREQISHLLKLTPRMVNRHVRENGMPIVSRGQYDMVACVQWYITFLKEQIDRARRGDETEQQARARLIKATANLRELELEREEGHLIAVENVSEQWQRIVIAFKSKLLSLPSKLAQKLLGVGTLAEMKSLLEAELYEALSELSTLDIPPAPGLRGAALKESEDPDAVDHQAPRTAAKAHRKRVGGPGESPQPGVKRGAGEVADGAG